MPETCFQLLRRTACAELTTLVLPLLMPAQFYQNCNMKLKYKKQQLTNQEEGLKLDMRKMKKYGNQLIYRLCEIKTGFGFEVTIKQFFSGFKR